MLNVRKPALVGAVVLISASFLDPSAIAQPQQADDFGGSGFSDQGLAAIQNMMETAVRDGRMSSGIAMLAGEEDIFWLKTVGDMGPDVPMREDAIIPLASVGKMYTAVAAMILVERGVISLEDPVSKYIPEFGDLLIKSSDVTGETSLSVPTTPAHRLSPTDPYWRSNRQR